MSLAVKEGDELDFIQYKDSYYILAKKSDIAKLITGNTVNGTKEKNVSAQLEDARRPVQALSDEEISVLKKLDTIRYNMRTPSEVGKIIKDDEKRVFAQLVKKKIVSMFKDENQKVHYSIQKSIYDAYLMRKKDAEEVKRQEQKQEYSLRYDIGKSSDKIESAGTTIPVIEDYIDLLQKNGFVVIQTEPEASAISSALEDSIRHGLVVGTRAFNKKFYIAMRSFINTNMPVIMAQIGDKSASVQDIAKACRINDDAVRTVLYILSESGEVTEVRKDIFRAA